MLTAVTHHNRINNFWQSFEKKLLQSSQMLTNGRRSQSETENGNEEVSRLLASTHIWPDIQPTPQSYPSLLALCWYQTMQQPPIMSISFCDVCLIVFLFVASRSWWIKFLAFLVGCWIDFQHPLVSCWINFQHPLVSYWINFQHSLVDKEINSNHTSLINIFQFNSLLNRFNELKLYFVYSLIWLFKRFLATLLVCWI